MTLDPGEVDFTGTGLVSAFIRHTLDEPPALAGTSERNVVQIADPALPPKSRLSDRSQIRKNLERGYELRLVPGPRDERRAAGRLPRRLRADDAPHRRRRALLLRRRLLRPGPRSRRAPGWPWRSPPMASVAAASIAARSDGYLHYYLSGSADSHLRDSPMKNVVAALVELSAELGLPLNLGGGMQPRRPRSRSSSAASPTASSPGAPPSWSATPRPTRGSQRPAASRPGFFPAYRGRR